MYHPPHEKRTHSKCTNILEAFQTFADMARTRKYKEEVIKKAGVRVNRPPCAALNYLDALNYVCCQL